MSLWSSIVFTLATITNLLVALFYPIDKGAERLGEAYSAVVAAGLMYCIVTNGSKYWILTFVTNSLQ